MSWPAAAAARRMPSLVRLIRSPDVAGDCAITPDGDARREAEARARLEAMLAEARQAAHAAGFEAGRHAGFLEASGAMEEGLALLRTAAEHVVAARVQALLAAEGDAVALAIEVAGRIVQRAAESDRELAVTVVREALRRVADRSRLTIRVNSEDLALVSSHRTEWVELLGSSGVVDVVADRRVPRGSAEVISPSGIVDARLPAMLDEARRLADSPLRPTDEDLPL